MAGILQRTVFETSRAFEYFDAGELQAQTGQPIENFSGVALKELVDNALDGCETAGVAPVVEVVIAVRPGPDRIRLTVADNGPGIPAETVVRLLNFEKRVSDKAAYRSPTRGAQGNALKTVLGIPHALGCREPVMIEARGVRHRLSPHVSAAGDVRVLRVEERSAVTEGTRVTLELPITGQRFDAKRWARAFALFNPHATVRTCTFDEGAQHANGVPATAEDSYHPTVEFPGGWRKFLPTDYTSPFWYDRAALARLVDSYIGAARSGGQDRLLRDFVREFRGLSGTARAKAVCAEFPGRRRLSDFDGAGDEVARLLTVMQRTAGKPPSPRVLGLVGEEHLRARLAAWFGVRRWWYARAEGETVDGIPFIFEVGVAETEQAGELFTGVNFSPSFGDPFTGTLLSCEKFRRHGLRAFLESAHASPPSDAEDGARVAVAAHLSCPALAFMDRGKSRLQVPGEMARALQGALWKVTRQLYQEEERRRKDAARTDRQIAEARRAEAPPSSLKDAVFEVLPAAIRRASGNGGYPYSSRRLYYQVRRLIQQFTDRELEYTYFSQDLLGQYRKEGYSLEGHYYDARGVLYEPHTGREVALGTREVDDYRFPEWVYDKILYVEKKGFWPILKVARLAERYDLAVVAAEGYASEAARTLFANAQRQRAVRLFVLHDADPDGYNIARTLAEATRRMPEHHVEVIDLGLKLETALAMGLGTEVFTRKKALPEGLKLSPLEKQYFEGKAAGWRSWICERVELDAMTAPQLVEYLEQGLAAAGATTKVIPPEAHLAVEAGRAYQREAARLVEEALADLLATDGMTDRVAARFRGRCDLSAARAWIEAQFTDHPLQSWSTALDRKVERELSAHQEELRAAVREELLAAVRDGE